MAKYDRVLGIDLGNGLVKVRSIDKKGREYRITFPSAWSYLKEVGESINSASIDLDTYTIDGVQYVWGNDIAKVKGLIPTYGHDNRYKTEAFKIMAKIVMARMVVDLDIQPKEKVLVVTGVPTIEVGTDKEDEISEAFKGIHEVGVGEEEYMFKVTHVEVMPQALSTVIGRYLDEHGGVEDERYESMKVAVIDIGGGTTDLDIVHALRRQREHDSIPVGFRDVYDGIRKVVRGRYPAHNVSDYSLLEDINVVIKNSKGKGKDKYTHRPSDLKEPVDFTKALNDGVYEIAIRTQQAIMSQWKNQTDLDEILLVGGSAELFYDYIEDIAEGITIPSNNGDSNVEGYYRFGVYLSEN